MVSNENLVQLVTELSQLGQAASSAMTIAPVKGDWAPQETFHDVSFAFLRFVPLVSFQRGRSYFYLLKVWLRWIDVSYRFGVNLIPLRFGIPQDGE